MIRRAATAPTERPVATEPVNVMCRTSSCSTRSRAGRRAGAKDDVAQAGGQPGLDHEPARCRRVVSGVSSEGLATTALPAARLGATPRASWVSGAFQGVMWAMTPSGSRSV